MHDIEQIECFLYVVAHNHPIDHFFRNLGNWVLIAKDKYEWMALFDDFVKFMDY